MPNGYFSQVLVFHKFSLSVIASRFALISVTGLVLSGGATVLFSTSSSLTMFAALWFLNGFAQGAGWPACAKLLKKVKSSMKIMSYCRIKICKCISFF